MELVYPFFICLSENWFIALIFLLSYRKDFTGFFKLLALTIGLSASLNAFLKELWQVPLDPSLGKVWWGFPSGHMQNAAIFYLGLALYARKLWVFITSIIVLYGISEAFIYYKFHDTSEIIAAIGTALILLTVMNLVYEFNKSAEVLAPIYCIVTVILSSWVIFLNLAKELTYYSWLFITLAMSLAIAITTSLFSCYDLHFKDLILNKKLDILIGLSFCVTAAFIMQAFKLKLLPHTPILYFFIPFILFFSITCFVPILRFNFFKKRIVNAI
ncbi:MAG: AcidPPc domain-containing protein [Candidatus Midichloria mitochondrii]|uniref:Phosphatidic acid phosphatase type 2/haloperoxidase domain-containing protein n=1 Tax=Midichloria mitochondrii (strain IricVA) TaxID=696127 RepID=F7XW64_MIDMI|nr:hypothetical protein midi_00614 [Candidatus Midichloria mitochondrii IricVA]MDJ1299340.1 hypothetical protein [Candidatus Midichloria mitochondrii]MDJ1313465.1 hypothetical protein [Candidatus Midichloria mitochondrii]